MLEGQKLSTLKNTDTFSSIDGQPGKDGAPGNST